MHLENVFKAIFLRTGKSEKLDQPNLNPWEIIYRLLNANEAKKLQVSKTVIS
jgi:hypothetical protein